MICSSCLFLYDCTGLGGQWVLYFSQHIPTVIIICFSMFFIIIIILLLLHHHCFFFFYFHHCCTIHYHK